MAYVYLVVAVAFEVVATSTLKLADGFTRPLPSALTIAGYVISFYFLSLTMRTMPVGIVYAVWSGAGIVMIAAIGLFYFKQRLDAAALIGLALILAGVLVINLCSRSVSH